MIVGLIYHTVMNHEQAWQLFVIDFFKPSLTHEVSLEDTNTVSLSLTLTEGFMRNVAPISFGVSSLPFVTNTSKNLAMIEIIILVFGLELDHSFKVDSEQTQIHESRLRITF